MDMVIEAKKQAIEEQNKKEEQVRSMGLDPNEARTNPAAFIQKLNAMKDNQEVAMKIVIIASLRNWLGLLSIGP